MPTAARTGKEPRSTTIDHSEPGTLCQVSVMCSDAQSPVRAYEVGSAVRDRPCPPAKSRAHGTPGWRGGEGTEPQVGRERCEAGARGSRCGMRTDCSVRASRWERGAALRWHHGSVRVMPVSLPDGDRAAGCIDEALGRVAGRGGR